MACQSFNLKDGLRAVRVTLTATFPKIIKDPNPSKAFDYLSEIISKLKGNDLYKFEESVEIDNLKEALIEAINTSVPLKMPKFELFKAKFLESVENAVNSAFNIETVSDFDSVEVDSKIIDQDNSLEDNLKSIDQLFLKGSILKGYLVSSFKNNFTDIALFDPERGTVTRSNSDLNYNIAEYKNSLYNDLVSFLKDVKKNNGAEVENFGDNLYSDSGLINIEGLNKAILSAKTIFDAKSMETLKGDYLNQNRNNNSKLTIKAYLAYALLQKGNFDYFLRQELGNNFKISDNFFGREVNRTESKYSFGTDNKMRKSWNETDNIDMMDNTTGVAKLLVERTQLYYQDGRKNGSNTVTLRQFYNTFNKIVSPKFLEEHSNINGLKPLLLELHGNSYRIKDIMKILYTNLKRINLPSYNKDVIYSIYKRFYDENNSQSLWSLEKENILNSPAVTNYSVIEILNNLIIRSAALTYTTYQYDNNSKSLVSRHILKGNNLGKRIKRENAIQVLTKYRNDRTNIINKYNIKVDPNNKNLIIFSLNGSGNKEYVYDVKDLTFVGGDPTFLKANIEEVLKNPDKLFVNNNDSTFKDFLELCDDFLGTEFLVGDGDLMLALRSVDDNKYIKRDIMGLLGKTILLNKVYSDFENPEINIDNLNLRDFTTLKYSNLEEASRNFYDETDDSLKITDSKNLESLENFATAEQIVSQEVTKSVVKDATGNSLASNGITNLASNLKYFISNRILSRQDSALRGNLFVENFSSLLDPSIKTDVKLRDGRTKSVKQFTEAELGYSSIIFDFYSNLFSKGNFISTVASVYSDKTRMYMWDIKNNLKVNGKNINFKSSSIEELIDAYKTTVGSYYHNLDNNIVEDYTKVLTNGNEFDPEILKSLENTRIALMSSIKESAELIEAIKSGSGYIFETSQKLNGKFTKRVLDLQRLVLANTTKLNNLNQVLDAIANIKNSPEALNLMSEIQRISTENEKITLENEAKLARGEFNVRGLLEIPEFSLSKLLLDNKELVKSIIKVIPEKDYNNLAFNKGVDNILHLHSSREKLNIVKRNGDQLDDSSISFMKPNTGIEYLTKKRFSPENSTFDIEYEREKKRFVKDLIAANTNFYTLNKNGTPVVEIKQIISKIGIPGYAAEWVSSEFGELIIAKDENGKPLNKLNPLTEIRDNKKITLNPILERYFISNILVQQNLRLAVVGTEFNHPNKAKGFKGDLTIEDFELEEAARWGAQNKRNVIIPATLMNYGLNSITGITNTSKVAIIEDLPAKVYNYKGDQTEVDSHDGSVFTNPLHAILENLSLQDQSVGEDKKPIGHDYSGRYGTSTLMKCATFMITNEKMRISQRAPINGYKLFKKMSDLNWNNEIAKINAERGTQYNIDLTKNIFGEELTLKDILEDKSLFIKDGNKFYKILELRKPNELENGYNLTADSYVITRREVNDDGTIRGLMPETYLTEINSLYSLHAALGGIYSMGLRDGKLAFDDSSLYTTVRYMNNVGFYESKSNEFPTQENTFQPLKHFYIAHQGNTSAFKQGSQHINSASAWHDDSELKYMIYNNDGTGVQMDSDHIVTDDHGSTMSEPTQVTSALEANGLTHNITSELYKDLGKASLALVQEELDAMEEYKSLDENKKSAVYELVGKIIMKNMKKEDKEMGLTKAMVDKVRNNFKTDKNHLADEYKIPFSDPNIFSTAINAMASSLNKSAIKKKFPGSGSVMSPAYDFMQVFQDQYGNIRSYDDLLLEAIASGYSSVEEMIDDTQNKIEEDLLNNRKTIDKVLPGETIKVITDEGTLVEIVVDSMDKYNTIKQNYHYFVPVVNKSRNLKPSEIYWSVKGKRYCIYDLPIIQHAFKIRSSKKLTKQEDIALQNEILKVFEALEKGIMLDGNSEIAIDPNSLVNNPAEMIVSKMYMKKFGLDANDSIGYVKSQGKNFFINKYDKLHSPKTNKYDIMFTRANGKHTYIKVSNDISGLNRVDTSENQYTKDNIIYRTDEDGDELYPLYKIEEVDGKVVMTPIIIPYLDINNNEILIVKDFSIISDIYESNDFDGVTLNSNSNNALDIIEVLKLNQDNIREFKTYLTLMEETNPSMGDSNRIKNAIIKNQENIKAKREKYAQERYVSFLKSQEFVVARIPAQTLQSFMKMEAVQFTNSDKNVVYVSHWQTWLQGSDYDIDKAYIMGSEFDDNGLYSGWSPFFDRTTKETLERSLTLPTPDNRKRSLNRNKKGENITDLVNIIATLRAKQEELYANLDYDNLEEYETVTLEFLKQFNFLLNATQKSFNLFSNASEENNNLVMSLLNKHNMYFIGKNKNISNKKFLKDRINRGLKNAVSSKIMGVIHNLKNCVAATTPINMDSPQGAASKSSLGKESARITSLSPSSIWKMVVQNMDGRQVIGIAATGEKIFFANCFYFNEMLKNGNIDMSKFMFNRTYKQLEKVPVLDEQGNQKLDENGKPVYMKTDTVKYIMANLNFKLLEDANLKNIIEQHMKELGANDSIDPIVLAQSIKTQLGLQEDQSLVISALLSAATDNAKELILSKINAGPQLAGIYLHLIMLGFDFDNIAEFMTSSVIQKINDLSKSNIFDEYNPGTSGSVISKTINLIKFGPNIEQYLNSQDIRELYYLGINSKLYNSEEVSLDIFPMYLGALYKDNQDLSKMFVKDKFNHRINRFFRDFKYYSDVLNDFNSTDENREIFEQFQLLREQSSETTTLGQAYGLNQGMKTNLAQRLKFINNLEGVFMRAVSPLKELDPSKIDDKELFQHVSYAIENDMFDNFEIIKFLDDPTYKNVTIELYNMFKSQWNIFDMIDKVPHYNALYKVLSLSYKLDEGMSVKYKLIKNIVKQYKSNADKYDKSLSDDDYKVIEEYVDDVLIVEWLADNDVFITLDSGEKFITNDGDIETADTEITLDLTTDGGRASFKYWMENSLIPNLKKGIIPGKDMALEVIKNNRFISGLQYARKTNKLDNGSIIFRKLPIDMLNLNNEFILERFEKYEQGLKELFKIKFKDSDLSIGDLFFLYNLLVNKNRFGADNLTTIFKNCMDINDSKSLLSDYMKYLGQKDYVGSEKFHNFVYEDILIRMAPRIYPSQAYDIKKPYVRMFYPETKRFELFRLTKKEVIRRRKKSSFLEDMDEFFSEDSEVMIDDFADDSFLDEESTNKETFDSGPYELVEVGTKKQRDTLNANAIIRTPKFTEKLRGMMLSEDLTEGELEERLNKLVEKNTINIKIKCK